MVAHNPIADIKIEQDEALERGIPYVLKKNGMLGCPFCGRAPEVTLRPGTDREGRGYVCFVSCMCGGYSARAHQFGQGDDEDQAKIRSVAAWNSRAA